MPFLQLIKFCLKIDPPLAEQGPNRHVLQNLSALLGTFLKMTTILGENILKVAFGIFIL